jgi:hypothetical protein
MMGRDAYDVVVPVCRDREESDWRDHDAEIRFGLIRTAALLRQTAVLEQQIWDEQNYGDLLEEGYGEHIERGRTFAAFAKDDCVGVTRLFDGDADRLPPFLLEALPFYNEHERAALIDGVQTHVVEELGTAAVVAALRRGGVATRLWRLAYRDARERGVRELGVIMEPERVQRMNRCYAFNFRQLGPAVLYQGGYCAAHVLDLRAVERHLQRHAPVKYWWFVKRRLQP